MAGNATFSALDNANGHAASTQARSASRGEAACPARMIASTAPKDITFGAGVPTQVAGWWWADLRGVPTGDMTKDCYGRTPTATKLSQYWDYWDMPGGSVQDAAAVGVAPTPWGGSHVVQWSKPFSDAKVYKKLNLTLTKDNWPHGNTRGCGRVPNKGDPADVSARYITYAYIPSGRFHLNPSHGWALFSEFKDNYFDASGRWHQDPTWGIGIDNWTMGHDVPSVSLAPSTTSSRHFLLSQFTDRWVKWELRVFQGARDSSGHGGRVELYADDRLLDTGYEPTRHVGSAAFSPLSRTLCWTWATGMYTSDQTFNGVPDWRATSTTTYIGLSTVLPLR